MCSLNLAGSSQSTPPPFTSIIIPLFSIPKTVRLSNYTKPFNLALTNARGPYVAGSTSTSPHIHRNLFVYTNTVRTNAIIFMSCSSLSIFSLKHRSPSSSPPRLHNPKYSERTSHCQRTSPQHHISKEKHKCCRTSNFSPPFSTHQLARTFMVIPCAFIVFSATNNILSQSDIHF